jgi:hypothetical protein
MQCDEGEGKGRKARGCPKLTWTEVVKNDMEGKACRIRIHEIRGIWRQKIPGMG